ncbi:hypothetical protein DFH08DRAFT_955663 [Mycena albidolilacea]|uniref:Uncharacterized protein n=1 Tax=Mycena albidolilacea TaxID=1033008 RepID=A0AAD7EVH0_9AGAR|nr:hypothetical protein DFH08DRAFT_955663 [Mycena albidolilacea]
MYDILAPEVPSPQTCKQPRYIYREASLIHPATLILPSHEDAEPDEGLQLHAATGCVGSSAKTPPAQGRRRSASPLRAPSPAGQGAAPAVIPIQGQHHLSEGKWVRTSSLHPVPFKCLPQSASVPPPSPVPQLAIQLSGKVKQTERTCVLKFAASVFTSSFRVIDDWEAGPPLSTVQNPRHAIDHRAGCTAALYSSLHHRSYSFSHPRPLVINVIQWPLQPNASNLDDGFPGKTSHTLARRVSDISVSMRFIVDKTRDGWDGAVCAAAARDSTCLRPTASSEQACPAPRDMPPRHSGSAVPPPASSRLDASLMWLGLCSTRHGADIHMCSPQPGGRSYPS